MGLFLLAVGIFCAWTYWSYRIWRVEGLWVLLKYNLYQVPGALVLGMLEIARRSSGG